MSSVCFREVGLRLFGVIMHKNCVIGPLKRLKLIKCYSTLCKTLHMINGTIPCSTTTVMIFHEGHVPYYFLAFILHISNIVMYICLIETLKTASGVCVAWK